MRCRVSAFVWARSSLALATALASVSCGEAERVCEGKYFEYHLRQNDLTDCAGAAAGLDTYLDVIRGSLGLRPYDGPKFTYEKYLNTADLVANAPCGPDARACNNGKTIWESRAVAGHELVHVTAYGEQGHFDWIVLDEGLAAGLSCSSEADVAMDGSWDWRVMGAPGVETFGSYDYAQSAYIALGVVRALGWDGFFSFQRALGADPPIDAISAELTSVGIDLDAMRGDLATRKMPSCLPVFACSGPELEEGTTTLTAGDLGYDRAVLPSRSGSVVRLRREGSTLTVMGCELGSLPGTLQGLELTVAAPPTDYVLALPSDRHALWFSDVEDLAPQRSTTVSLSYVQGAFVDACNAVEPIRIETGRSVTFVLTGTRTESHVALAFDPTITTLRLKVDELDAASVEMCEGCSDGGAIGCVPVSFKDQTGGDLIDMPVAGGSALLRITHALEQGVVRKLTVRSL